MLVNDVVPAIAMIVVLTLGGVYRSYQQGYIKQLRRQQRDVRTMAEIDRNVQDIHATVENIDENVADMGKAILVLHKDDEDVDQSVLQEQLDVDQLPSNIRNDD